MLRPVPLSSDTSPASSSRFSSCWNSARSGENEFSLNNTKVSIQLAADSNFKELKQDKLEILAMQHYREMV